MPSRNTGRGVWSSVSGIQWQYSPGPPAHRNRIRDSHFAVSPNSNLASSVADEAHLNMVNATIDSIPRAIRNAFFADFKNTWPNQPRFHENTTQSTQRDPSWSLVPRPPLFRPCVAQQADPRRAKRTSLPHTLHPYVAVTIQVNCAADTGGPLNVTSKTTRASGTDAPTFFGGFTALNSVPFCVTSARLSPARVLAATQSPSDHPTPNVAWAWIQQLHLFTGRSAKKPDVFVVWQCTLLHKLRQVH
jgi:hypothetical protein